MCRNQAIKSDLSKQTPSVRRFIIYFFMLTFVYVFYGCSAAIADVDVSTPGNISGEGASNGTIEQAEVPGLALPPHVIDADSNRPVLGSGTGIAVVEDYGPSSGGELRLFALPMNSLEPYSQLNPYISDLSWFLSDSLVRVDQEGIIELVLAKTITASQEGRIWDISIHQDVLLHNGRFLNADDIVASITKAAAAEDGPYSSRLGNLNRAEKIGTRDIRLILEEADTGFVKNLEFPIFGADSWEADGAEVNGNFAPNGTGAYTVENISSRGIDLVRFNKWWQAVSADQSGSIPKIERIRFIFGETESDRILKFQQNTIDAVWVAKASPEIFANRADIEVRTFPGNGMEFLLFGSDSNVFTNAEVRSLISAYIAGRIEEGEFEGTAVQEGNNEILSEVEAIELLTAAGGQYRQTNDELPLLFVPGRAGLRQAVIAIRYNALNLKRQKTAQWISAELQKIGITAYLQEVSADDKRYALASGDFDLIILGNEAAIGATDEEMIAHMRSYFPSQLVTEVIPIYREQYAVLYNRRIRGEKSPTGAMIYGGWQSWYLLEPIDPVETVEALEN